MLWSIYFLPDQPNEEKKPDAGESDDNTDRTSTEAIRDCESMRKYEDSDPKSCVSPMAMASK
jgi:hypothetical protein